MTKNTVSRQFALDFRVLQHRRCGGRRVLPLPSALPLLSALLLGAATLGCDTEKKGTAAPAEPAEAAEVAEVVPVLPKGPPEFSVDEVSPRVGFARAVVMKNGKPHAEGLEELRTKLEEAKSHITGQSLEVRVHRQAHPAWVTTYLNEIGKLGPKSVEVLTDTRPNFPAKLTAVPETQLSSPPQCSLVGMILDDRGSAIWRLSGGTARKRGRGMGGPDLTMTAETILSMVKGCPDSTLFFVAGAEGVEWGLLYDLAASALTLEKAKLYQAVFPSQPVVAGHPIELLK